MSSPARVRSLSFPLLATSLAVLLFTPVLASAITFNPPLQVTGGTFSNSTPVAWSPDGGRLLLDTYNPSSQASAIRVVQLGGGGFQYDLAEGQSPLHAWGWAAGTDQVIYDGGGTIWSTSSWMPNPLPIPVAGLAGNWLQGGTISPDGQWLYYTTGAYGTSEPQAVRVPVSGGTEQPLAVSQPGQHLSPDGARLAYSAPTGQARIMDLDPIGNDFAFTGNPGWEQSAPNWSPDGSRVVWAESNFGDGSNSNQGRIWAGSPTPMWADPNRQPDVLLGEFPFHVTSASYSPDGQFIAFTGYESFGGPAHVYVMQASGGEAVQLPGFSNVLSGPIWSPVSNQFAFEDGSTYPAQTFIVHVDGDAPSPTPNTQAVLQTPPDASGWISGTDTLTLVSDIPGTIWWQIDSGNVGVGWLPYNFSTIMMPEGTHTLQFYNQPADGSAAEPQREFTTKVDPRPPTKPQITLSQPDGTSAWSLAWNSVEDTQSGFDHFEVREGIGARTTVSGTSYRFTNVDLTKSHSWTVFAVDRVGNSSWTTVDYVPSSAPQSKAIDHGIVLGFDGLIASGTDSVQPVNEAQQQPAPSDYRLVAGTYYDVAVSSLYSGDVTITVPYDPTGLTPAEEASLRLFHWKTDHWEDVTSSVDTENNVVIGRTSSFSPFAIFAPSNPATQLPVTGTPASSWWSLSFLALCALAIVGLSVRPVAANRDR